MNANIVRLFTLVVLAAGAAACDSGAPTSPPSIVGPAELQVTDLTVGTGATLVAGQTVTVNYALWLYDPTRPDQKGTQIPSQTPANVTIASGSIIQGWVQGLPGMRVGGIRRLVIPPSLAYGSTGQGTIPPNTWLVFDVELLAILN